MKILVLHCAYQYKGGEDTVVEEEIGLLTSEGHEVELLLFSNAGNNFLKVLSLPFNVSSYVKTRKKLKAFKPDIVHLHNIHFAASPSVIYAIKRSNIPFVNTLHNYRLLCPSGTLFFDENPFLDSLNQRFPFTAIKKGVYRHSKLLTFWLAFSLYIHQIIGTWKLCNKYIVLTEHAREILLTSKLNLKNDQLVIKPNFCVAPPLASRSREPHFLFIGRFTIEKGIRLLLNVFAGLEYKIKLAGDGPLKSEVIEFAKKNANIEFLGSLNKQQVFKELQTCSALIFPSIWFEGMPLTIIEAFSCGTPVIASRLGAMDSMVTNEYNGLHFEPNDQSDLENQVKKWAQMNEIGKQLYQKNAFFTYKEVYSPEKNAKEFLEIYSTAIQEYKSYHTPLMPMKI